MVIESILLSDIRWTLFSSINVPFFKIIALPSLSLIVVAITLPKTLSLRS